MATYEEQNRQKREKKLKDRLRRGVPAPAFESLWQRLLEEDYIEDGHPRDGYEDLKADAERIANIQRETLEEAGTYSGPRPGRTPREEADESTPEELTEYELRCARAYSEYIGTQTAKRPDVLQFRVFALGGAWPTGEEADEELEELAGAALLGRDEALALASSREYQDPGSGLRLRYAPDDEAKIFVVEVGHGSILDKLRGLSEKLADGLPWHPADAARWLLTGVPVKATPIRTRRYHHDDTITITALPFVDARTVTASYRRMQRRLKGGDNQRVSAKALDVLLFVEERTNLDGERPGLGALLKEWNARHPGHAYKNREDLYRACRRAYVALIGRGPLQARRL